MTAVLIDDRSEPSLREVIGHYFARATEADFAVARIRLAGIDLGAGELAAVRRCRVLVGRLDVHTLSDTCAPAAADPAQRTRLLALRAFVESGRLEVRAAGLAAWTPDFSIMRGVPGIADGIVALVGAHYFARPYPDGGLALTCVLTGAPATADAEARFGELWARGYDVAAVVRDALLRLEP